MKSVSLQHVAFFFLLFYVVVFRRKLFEGLTAKKNVSERAETLMKCECGDGPLSTWCNSSLPVGEVLSPF